MREGNMKSKVTKLFIGEYKTALTDGHRVAIPKAYRDQFGTNSIIINRGYEGCLVVVEKDKFNALLEGVLDIPFISGDKRETSRFLLSNAFEVSIDAQGRVIIPDSLSNYATLSSKDVVFIGVGSWIEIWNGQTWEQYQTKLSMNSNEIANRLLAIKQA